MGMHIEWGCRVCRVGIDYKIYENIEKLHADRE